MNLLAESIAAAAEAHRGQVDQGGNPYILHALEVMYKIRAQGYDETVQAAVVLHDVKEDSPHFWLSWVDHLIRNKIETDRLEALVNLMSKIQDERYGDYITRLIDSGNTDAIAIKMADLEHNSCITRLKGLRPKDLERISTYHQSYTRLKVALMELNNGVR